LAIEWKDYGRDELVVVEKIIGVSVLCANRRPNERRKVSRCRCYSEYYFSALSRVDRIRFSVPIKSTSFSYPLVR